MNWASQVLPFGHDIKVGEIVVLPSKINPVIHFGKIKGEYEFHPNNANPFYHSRKVEWFARSVPRNYFEQDILYSLGAFMTICRIKQEERVMEVVKTFMHGKKSSVTQPTESIDNAPETPSLEMDALANITNLIIAKPRVMV